MRSSNGSTNPQHLPLKPAVLLILTALAQQPRHGYAIMVAVREQSDGGVELGTSHLYRHLKKLLDQGWVVESKTTDEQDSRRRHYELSVSGRQILQSEMRRLQNILQVGHDLGLLDPVKASG